MRGNIPKPVVRTLANVSPEHIAELGGKGREMLAGLRAEGLYRPLNQYKARLEEGRITYGEGYPITAFEKFLGYYDRTNNTAFAPSVSMTTDFSIARCFCRYLREPGRDFVTLDGERDESYDKRARKALDIFREVNGIEGSFQFIITRDRSKYGRAKGLGESAAVAAAASRALVANVFGEEATNDDSFVSRYAKLVSGSGSRSVTGGISVWVSFPGIPEEQSYGIRLPFDTSNFYFAVYPAMHGITTLKAHDVAMSSDFYQTWAAMKYDKVMNLIRGRSIKDLMEQAQLDMFKLNALMMTGGKNGGTVIQTPESLEIIQHVVDFQNRGKPLYMTADTGPSIVIMSNDRSVLGEFIAEEKERSWKTPIIGAIPKRVSSEANTEELRRVSDLFASLRT